MAAHVVIPDDREAELWELVQAWPKLDDELRDTILVVVRSAVEVQR